MKIQHIFPIILFTLLIHACSPLRVTTDYDHQADFAKYTSFAFHEKGIEKLQVNDLDKRRIVANITENLAAKGMKLASDTQSADLIINVMASNKEVVDVNYYNNYYWGWYYYPWVDQPSVSEYTEGNLVIDLVDSKTNTLVWTSRGSGFRVDNLNQKEEAIREAIAAIFKNYPPMSKN